MNRFVESIVPGPIEKGKGKNVISGVYALISPFQ